MSWKRTGLTSIYVMTSTVSTQMLQWAIMASLAHHEGPKILGIYALGQAIALPLQFLSFLSIRQRYLTLDDRLEENFLAMRATVPALTYVLSLGVIYLIFGLSTIWKMSAFILILKYVEGFFDLAYAKMQKEGRGRSLANISVVRSIVSILLFEGTYWGTSDLYLSMLTISVQQVALLWYIRKDLLAFLPSTGNMWTFSIASAAALLPFAFSLVLTSLSSSLPRLILSGLMGAQELGYYTAVIAFISIGQIAVGSLGQSLLKPLADALRRHDQSAFWLNIFVPIIVTQLVCCLAAVLSLVIGAPLVNLVYGPNFGPAAPLLTTASIAIGPFFAASFLTAALFAAGKKYALVANQLVASAVMLSLTFLLVPIYKSKGVFLAMGISGVCQMILCFLILFAYLQSPQSKRVAIS